MRAFRVARWYGEHRVWWVVYEGDAAICEFETEEEARQYRNELNENFERMER